MAQVYTLELQVVQSNKGNALDTTKGKLTGLAGGFSLLQGAALAALAIVARETIKFVNESNAAYAAYDTKLREIYTLLPGVSAEARDQLANDALELGKSLGRVTDETLPAIYQALSAGVPESNVLKTIETASEAARAGVAELDDTLELGLAILNAQVSGVTDLNDVYDQLFFIVKNGVVTLPELNSVMNQVTSVAGEAGVSLQDISAAMIVMTKQGDSASEAAELLSLVLVQLSTEGSNLADAFREASGQSFREFIAAGGTLAGAMQILQEASEETGTAIGDMLGDSPFFRDSQAMRGVLELTGKHLDDLVYYSEEAEDQFGTMSAAAAEFNGSMEILEGQVEASSEALKIHTGEALSPWRREVLEAKKAALDWADSIAIMVTEVTELKNEAHSMTDELVQNAIATGEYEEAVDKITRVMEENNNIIGGISGGYRMMKHALIDLIVATGDFDGSNQDLANSLTETLGKQFEVANGMVILDGQVIAYVADLERMREANTAFDEQSAAIEETSTGLHALTGQAAELIAATDAESVALQNNIVWTLADKEAKLGMTAADTAAAIAAGATKSKIEELTTALGEQLEIIQAAEEAFGGYVIESINTGDETVNWTNELFLQATQAGITREEIGLLAAATGEYTDEQIEAMLRTAAMKEAVNALAKELAAGNITVGEAITELENFEKQLESDYTASIDYADIVTASEEADELARRLREAEGTYTANFHTNYTTSGNPPTANEGGGTGYYAENMGGRFLPGQLLLVGDGPGGQVLPTSELVVFDRPGEVIPGGATNRIMQAINAREGSGNQVIHQYYITSQDRTDLLIERIQEQARYRELEEGM